MKAEFINPFLTALARAFDTMLGCQVERRELTLKTPGPPHHEISGVIGLSGHAMGLVVLSLSKSVALQAASTMLMTTATEIDDDVIDAVGELANVVAGGAKAQLEEYHLSVSLPSVVTGDGHAVRFPSTMTPLCVHYETPWGPMTLEFGLEPVAAEVGA